MNGALGKSDAKTSDAPAILISMLSSGSPPERAFAANRLGHIEVSPEAIPHLIALLGDDTNYSADREHRLIPYATLEVPTPGWEAARALAAIGQLAVQPLVRELQRGKAYSRQMAAYALGHLRTGGDKPEVVEALAGALNDGNPEVRAESAKALGVRAGRRAGGRNWMNADMRIPKYLLPRLKDEDARVRYEAARALGYSNSDEVLAPLFTVMEEDSNLRVRSAAALALGELDDPRAVTPLLGLVKEGTHQDERSDAARILARMTHQQAFDGLESILKSGSVVARLATIYALDECKNPKVVDLLIVALNDGYPDVRARAALYLAPPWNKDTRAVEPLIALLKDTDAFVRRCAAGALGELKDLRAVDPLRSLLTDVDQGVRVAARIALRKLRLELSGGASNLAGGGGLHIPARG
jgi:HEAT repeat protein